MREIRRKEKAISDTESMLSILKRTQYVTLAMCDNNEPYLVTLSHGYDESKNCIYFHCAMEGKKVDVLRKNNLVWGQALLDYGYSTGQCTHKYATTQFMGRVTFLVDRTEKRHGLGVIAHQLEKNPELVLKEQIKGDSLETVNVGRIDIEYMSGKKSKEVALREKPQRL